MEFNFDSGNNESLKIKINKKKWYRGKRNCENLDLTIVLAVKWKEDYKDEPHVLSRNAAVFNKT